MDGGRKGRSGNAETDVHPPGLSCLRRAVDAEGGLLPQAQVVQQHIRQAWLCKYNSLSLAYSWGLHYKTLYGRNLQISVTS